MKNVYILIIAWAAAALYNQEVQTASFILQYKGDASGHAYIGGKKYTIDRGDNASVQVDTGGRDALNGLLWDEAGISYEVTFPKSVAALDLGGLFTIFGKGKYEYYFGSIDAEKKIGGSAKQIKK